MQQRDDELRGSLDEGPVITLVGERFASQMTFSLLANLGLEEVAADSVEGYIAAAQCLSAELPEGPFAYATQEQLGAFHWKLGMPSSNQ